MLDPAHDRAGLAGDEPVRRGADDDPHLVQAGAAPFGGGLAEDVADVTVRDDHRLAGADHLRGEHRAIEDQVRRPGHQHLVLGAGGFPFGAVADHHRGAPGRHRGQLARGGEPGTAPAGQPGPVHLGDQRPQVPRSGPGHGGGPYRARWPSRLAGRGGSRRGSAPGAAALDDLAAARADGAARHSGALSRGAAGCGMPGPLAAGGAQPGQQPGQAGGRDRGGAAPLHQRHPPDPQVGASGDRMPERGRPGQVAEPVHRSPGPVAQPPPDQAGDEHRPAQIDRQGAQADSRRPVRGRERQHRGGPADPDVRVEDGREHVQHEERHAEQRERAVQLTEAQPGPAPRHRAEPRRDAEYRHRAEPGQQRQPAAPQTNHRTCSSPQPPGKYASGPGSPAAATRRRPG